MAPLSLRLERGASRWTPPSAPASTPGEAPRPLAVPHVRDPIASLPSSRLTCSPLVGAFISCANSCNNHGARDPARCRTLWTGSSSPSKPHRNAQTGNSLLLFLQMQEHFLRAKEEWHQLFLLQGLGTLSSCLVCSNRVEENEETPGKSMLKRHQSLQCWTSCTTYKYHTPLYPILAFTPTESEFRGLKFSNSPTQGLAYNHL